MTQHYNRVYQHFLGLTDDGPPFQRPDRPPHTVHLLDGPRTYVRHQAEVPGRYRSGPLFGRWAGEQLVVIHVTMARPCGLTTGDDVPFALHADYLLGWMDALRSFDRSIDWIGHWLMTPDRSMPDHDDQLRLLRQAAGLGLVTADLPVVFFGWRRFDLQAEAFTYTPSLGATPVVVEF